MVAQIVLLKLIVNQYVVFVIDSNSIRIGNRFGRRLSTLFPQSLHLPPINDKTLNHVKR